MAITNRDLPVGTRLVADYKKTRFVCTVEAGEEGEKLYVLEDGKRFKSPSAPGSAVMGSACNGWRFWSVEGEEPPGAEKKEPEKKAKKSNGGKRGKKPFQLIVRHESQDGRASPAGSATPTRSTSRWRARSSSRRPALTATASTTRSSPARRGFRPREPR